MSKITKDMSIGEVVSKYPKTIKVFMEHGLHCVGCHMANLESIEIGAQTHNIDLKKFLKELNDKIKEKK